MTIGEYLKSKRGARDLSLRDASKLAGISHVHIKDIENDKIKPTFGKVMNLLRAYHADIQDFLRETGYLPQNVEPVETEKLYKIPVVSWVIAEKLGEGDYSFQPEDTEEWITSDVTGQEVFALRVKDDTMEPEFREGDIIIVDPHIKPEHDDYIIVKNKVGEGATFKQLKKYGKTWVLHSLNPKYPDIELSDKHKFRIVGKVVKKEKRY